MIAYHGTVAGGLDTLKPFANPQSNLSYSCVYLSTCKALAAIYIWKHPFKWMTFEIPEDGIPLYNESFSGGLAHFYGGVKGYIYTCRGDFQTDENTTIRHAVVSRQPVRVEAAEVVEDAYAYILRCEREGLLRIHHFEDLSAEQRNPGPEDDPGGHPPLGPAEGGTPPLRLCLPNLSGTVGGSPEGVL